MSCRRRKWRTASGHAAIASGVPILHYSTIAALFCPVIQQTIYPISDSNPIRSRAKAQHHIPIQWLTPNSEANKTHRPELCGAVKSPHF